jgi:hypothetical protein
MDGLTNSISELEITAQAARAARKNTTPNRIEDIDHIMSFLMSLDDRITELENNRS